MKRYAVSYMEGCGSFEYCRGFMRRVYERAVELIEEVDAGRGLGGGVRAVLDGLMAF